MCLCRLVCAGFPNSWTHSWSLFRSKFLDPTPWLLKHFIPTVTTIRLRIHSNKRSTKHAIPRVNSYPWPTHRVQMRQLICMTYCSSFSRNTHECQPLSKTTITMKRRQNTSIRDLFCRRLLTSTLGLVTSIRTRKIYVPTKL